MMELISESNRIYLENEHLKDVALKFVTNSDWSGSDSVGNMIITGFVEMCIDIFGGGSGGSEAVSETTPIGSVIQNSPEMPSLSATSIVQKCLRKYRRVIRMYYDLKSVTLYKYLKQSDLNTARETALLEAINFFVHIRNKAVAGREEDPLLQVIKQRIGQEYSWLEAVNQQRKLNFFQRIWHQIESSFSEKVQLRYGSLFFALLRHEECLETKLQFCDEHRFAPVIEEFVNQTLEEFKEYLQFYSEECPAPEKQLKERLVQLKDTLLQRNGQTVQKAHTFLHNHMNKWEADCHADIKKTLEEDPFMETQHIHDNLIPAKRIKYIEEFSKIALFTDDNAEFQRDFKKQLNAKINSNAVGCLLEAANSRKEQLMAQFSHRLQHDLHQLVCKLSKEHGLRQRHANKINVDLIARAMKSLEWVQHEVHVETTKWAFVPIPDVCSSSFLENNDGQGGAGAFSIQLSFNGLRVGLLQNHVPHVLQYTTADNTDSSMIPLEAGVTFGYPGKFVFGHEVQEWKELGCLRSSWNLAKMLLEKEHCRTNTKQDPIKLVKAEFTPTFEFLFACILKRCKKLCVDSVEKSGGGGGSGGRNISGMVSVLEKCLISVPSRLLPFQRLQIKDAGRIAGFLDDNFRIVDNAFCLVSLAEEQGLKENMAGASAVRSPQDSTNQSEEVLVMSQYKDFHGRVKLDFVQYKRVNSTKMHMKHYIDEEIIVRNHLAQCKSCKPSSPGNSLPCSIFGENLQESEASFECFFMAILKEVPFSITNNSKATQIFLHCELPECKKILDSALKQCLPNITRVKYCGELGGLEGLIQLNRGASWDKWVGNNNLKTRPCLIWATNRNGSVTRKLGGYKTNDPQTTSAIVQEQLPCTDYYQVCVNYDISEEGVDSAKIDTAWGCLTVSKEMSPNQNFCTKFVLSEQGVYKLATVEIYQKIQDQPPEFIYTLEVDKDYQWVTGNLTKGQLMESTTKFRELMNSRGSDTRSSSSSNSRRRSLSGSSSPVLSSSPINTSVPNASTLASNNRGRRAESDKRPSLPPSPCDVVKKKIRTS